MVDVLSPQPWTMNVLLNRKRSRLALDPEDDEDIRQRDIRQSSPALSAVSDTLKKTRTQCELDELDIVDPEHAWEVDVDGILSSHHQETPSGSPLQAHSNRTKYIREESIIVLCVQGNLHLHYDLLCSVLPDLYMLSPSLQAFVLCRDPSTHVPSTTAPFSLPLIQAIAPSYNHFVRLGLLHPLGGGKFPLDALVVIDPKGRRRLVLPFGWGAGRHAATPAGRTIQTKLIGILRECIEILAKE